MNFGTSLRILLVVLGFALQHTAFGVVAGDTGTATIAPDLLIVLDQSRPLGDVFISDLSSFSFSSQKEAEKFFNFYEDNLVWFKVFFATNEVYIHLNRKYTPIVWDYAKWQFYLTNERKRK